MVVHRWLPSQYVLQPTQNLFNKAPSSMLDEVPRHQMPEPHIGMHLYTLLWRYCHTLSMSHAWGSRYFVNLSIVDERMQ
jgi:hypothetical protein